MHHDVRGGILTGLAAYVLWGFLTVYWKQLSGVDAFQLIGNRIVWSMVVLVPLLALTGRFATVIRVRQDPALLGRLVAAALLLAANWTTYVWAVTHDNVVETALGYFIAPLGTMLIGIVVLHERLRPPQAVALGLAAAAVVVLTVDYGHIPGFALVLGATWSVYGLLKKLVPLGPFESLTGETLVLLPVALAVIVWGHTQGTAVLQTATTTQLVLVPLTGIVTTVPLLLFSHSAQRVPLTTLGPLQYAVPTINLVLGVFVYDEPMPPGRLAGFVLVWIALAIFTVDGLRAARQPELRMASAAISK